MSKNYKIDHDNPNSIQITENFIAFLEEILRNEGIEKTEVVILVNYKCLEEYKELAELYSKLCEKHSLKFAVTKND